jgi:hypothetical protein
MNLGRRFNAGAATHHTLRHVVTPEFNRRYATHGLANTYPALKRRPKFILPLPTGLRIVTPHGFLRQIGIQFRT